MPNRPFWTTRTDVFSVLFSSAVIQMPRYNTQRRRAERTLPRNGGFTDCLNFTASLNFDFRHDQSGFQSQKTFQPESCPFIRRFPTEQWSSVCQRRGLQPRREIVSVSAIPVVVKVFVTEPSETVNAEMAKQSEGRRHAFSRKAMLSLDLWLVVG